MCIADTRRTGFANLLGAGTTDYMNRATEGSPNVLGRDFIFKPDSLVLKHRAPLAAQGVGPTPRSHSSGPRIICFRTRA